MKVAMIAVSVTCLGLAAGGLLETSRPASAQSQSRFTPYRLPPIDDAKRQPAFAAFRSELIAAVKARNAPFVLDAAVAPLRPALQQDLSPSNASAASADPSSSSWNELERVLALGGSFTTTRGARKGREEFCAPYVYSTYPSPLNVIVEHLAGHDENPESDPWAILGDRVAVRSEPSASSPVLQYLSYDLVVPTGAQAPASPPVLWRKIFTPDGKTGWVAADQIRDPADYHACFADLDGKWTLTAFGRDKSPV